MTDPSDQYPDLDPVEQFRLTVFERSERLGYLADNLAFAMEIVNDLDRINKLITASDRPELVMTGRAEQLQLAGPQDISRTNNFKHNMRSFGIRVFEDYTHLDGEVDQLWIGRRHLDEEEMARFYLMGGRGNFDQFNAFAEAQGIDQETIHEMMLQTHIDKPTFMRMWILFPELTENLMNWCLDEVGDRDRGINEELFVAYTIMSKLIDPDDAYVRRDEDELDDWYLCR